MNPTSFSIAKGGSPPHRLGTYGLLRHRGVLTLLMNIRKYIMSQKAGVQVPKGFIGIG
jgi:hypothetical protein